MTIGIGFCCRDGIVICADRQITVTGYYKFPEVKLSHWNFENFTVAFTYAGEQSDGKAMARKVREAFEGAAASLKVTPEKESMRVLEETFRGSYQNDYDEGFEALVGICFKNGISFLCKTKNAKVASGSAEYIGAGDSSALRYMASFLVDNRPIPKTDEALIIGCYMVSVANRYVDGCSGGPDIVILHEDGNISVNSGGIFPNQEYRFASCEWDIGDRLRTLLLSGGLQKT